MLKLMTSPEVVRHLNDVDAIVVSVATATTRRRGRDETTGIRIRGGVRVAVLNPSAEQSQAGSRKEGRVSLLRSVMLLLREESNAEC